MSRKQKVITRIKGLAGSFVNAFLPVYEDKATHLLKYGADNLLPNKLLSFVADSGVATRASSKLAEYIASDGFVDETSAQFKVNAEQTADQLLQEQTQYLSTITAVAFHVTRKGGKVDKVKSIPVQCVRKQGDKLVYNETLGQPKYDKTKDKFYPKYQGAELPQSLIADSRFAMGEILYIYRKTPLNPDYGVPDYYAQIEDVRTSSELAKMDLELSLNGFMPSTIITVVGDIDDKTLDANKKTEADYYREDFRVFTGQDKDSNGLTSRFKALLQFAPTKDEVPTMQTIDIKSVLDASNTKRDVIERSVCRLFGVHPVLCGYSDASVLGNTQAIANASLELTKVANPFQRLMADAFTQLYPNMDWTISEYMPITYIDPSLFDKMTEDEIRNKLLGLPPKETDASGEGDKIVKAINSLSPLVANKVLESLTPDEIRALIGLGAKIVEPVITPTA
jgi:hypothetical protein